MNLVNLIAALLLFHAGIIFASSVRTIIALRRLRSLPLLEGQPQIVLNSWRFDACVSIIIPARNEEHNLRACVDRVLAQRGARIEIVIVDDQSEDRTLEIANETARKDSRSLVLRSADLPSGWTGKTYALHQGAGASTGEWLLFLDADVRLAPDAVGTALAFATACSIDLLSLSPLQHAEGFWERLLQPLVFDLLNEKYDLRAVNNPNSPIAAANGQFIMIRRHAYFQIGGYEAIKNHVLEDVALAQRAKQAGFRIYFANTRSLAETRMYGGLIEIWDGWTKNLFPLLNRRYSEVWTTILGQFVLWLAPFGTLLGSLIASGYNESSRAILVISGAIAVASLIGGTALVLLQLGGIPRYALLLPLGKLILVAMIICSWYKHTTGKGISWKGRAYKG